MKIPFIVFIVLMSIPDGCNNQNSKIPRKNTVNINSSQVSESKIDTVVQVSLDSSDLPCMALRKIDTYLDSIRRTPKLFFQDNDNCVTALIDSISRKFIQTSNAKYLNALASMCDKSDGYVSECLGYNLLDILKARPQELCNYLYSQRKKNTKDMMFLLVAEVTMEESPDTEARKDFFVIVNEQVKNKKVRDCILSSFKKIEAKIDSN